MTALRTTVPSPNKGIPDAWSFHQRVDLAASQPTPGSRDVKQALKMSEAENSMLRKLFDQAKKTHFVSASRELQLRKQIQQLQAAHEDGAQQC
mmetsp:Transcript_6260/g.13716  ORF Transcript_6260/g.13716 Transcript_6260/m.13716 type:complete len:93 (-) Transcript_6260:41-319(-)